MLIEKGMVAFGILGFQIPGVSNAIDTVKGMYNGVSTALRFLNDSEVLFSMGGRDRKFTKQYYPTTYVDRIIRSSFDDNTIKWWKWNGANNELSTYVKNSDGTFTRQGDIEYIENWYRDPDGNYMLHYGGDRWSNVFKPEHVTKSDSIQPANPITKNAEQYETVPTFKKTVNCVSTSTNSVKIWLVEYEPFVGRLAFSIKRYDGSVIKQQVADDKTNLKVKNLDDLPYGFYSLTVTGENLNRSNHGGNIQIEIDGNTVMDEMLGFHGEGNWSGYEYTFCLVWDTSSTLFNSPFKELAPDWFRSFHDTPQTWGFFGPFSMNTNTEEIGTFIASSDLISGLQSDIDNGVQYHYQNHMGDRDSLLIRVTDLLNDKYLAVPVVEDASYRSDSACFDYEVKELRVYLNSRNIWDYEIVGTIRDPQDPSTKMSTMLDCSLKEMFIQ